jgi:hypothetical protein
LHVAVTLALFFTLIIAVFANLLLQSQGLTGRRNYLPALVVLTTLSWNPEYQTLHSSLLACVAFLFSLFLVLEAYGHHNPFRQIFSAGFAIGMAGLFYLPAFYLIIAVWLSMITYRLSGWREYLISLIGFMLPGMYYVVYLFLTDAFPSEILKYSNHLFILQGVPGYPLMQTIWYYASATILIFTMIKILNLMRDKLINLRRKSWVIFNFTIAIIILTIFSGWPIVSVHYLFVIPFAFYISGSLWFTKKDFWTDLIILSYFLLFIGMRIYFYIR